jgi:Mn2+/Fe2+ NRAMP family transporter
MTTSDRAPAAPPPQPAPTDWFGTLRHIGPGLIISAVIVGSGELIVTPKLGASVGFTMLWFILLGCFIKVFVQIELGRFAVAHGMTTLEAMNTMPGPRFIVSWLLWLWLVMYVALVFQVAGMVGGLASVFALAGMPQPAWALTILVAGSCAVLLVVGRYRLVERLSTALVVIFTLATLIAVGALQATPFAITGAQLAEGLKFHLPDKFTTAFAAFGIIGVGASELIYYPYWCLEKGYARHIGPNDHSAGWLERAHGWLRVMRVDAWISFVIYTTATLAFYLLGAAVLHAKGLAVENNQMIATLSHMYRETFGQWSYWLFLVGAFAVLYSTVFGATASNARLLTDALSLFGVIRYRSADHRAKTLRVCCVLLPCAFAAVFLLVGEPVSLVFVGALAQGLMLPFLAFAALYFHYRRTEAGLKPGGRWVAMLWFAAVAMGAVGLYKVGEELLKVFQ